MIKKTLLLLALFGLCISNNVAALDLFKAEYTVFKDGKQIGTSSIELTQDSSFYTITDNTIGTHGMASFLGFKRSETTHFTEKNNNFTPNYYEIKQKVAFQKKYSSYQVDEKTQMIYGKNKGNDWQVSIPNNFLTPNLVSLKLFQDICAKKTSVLNYNILKNGELKSYSFKISSTQNNIIEIDKIHSNPNTITKTWLDATQNCIPIKTYHKEKNEDALETKLTLLTFNKA